jgi:hypothetical protein
MLRYGNMESRYAFESIAVKSQKFADTGTWRVFFRVLLIC